MSNYLLFAPWGNRVVEVKPDAKGQVVQTYRSSNYTIEVDDKIVLVQRVESEPQTFLPFAFKVVIVANQTAPYKIVLQLEAQYTQSLEVSEISESNRPAFNRSADGKFFEFTALTQEQYENLLDELAITPEQKLLTHVQSYIAAKGYYFSEETVKNYHICLKSRPFVILAGLSGTGKSKLSQLYAEALGHNVANKRYLRLAVRPGWNDDRYLLGYLNSITGEYVTEPALDFLMRAANDPDNLYFLCLDEMNLAHVEYYFSQFLSALEEDNQAERLIPLLSESVQKQLSQIGKSLDVPAVVVIPPNVLFTGTINVDETTQPLSDKVIDRSNTIEFFQVELDKMPTPQPLPPVPAVPVFSKGVWAAYCSRNGDGSKRSQIIEINQVLNKAELGFGYRILRDIEIYLANSKGLLDLDVAFDLQVKQRILPHVRGTKNSIVDQLFVDLIHYCQVNNLPRSEKRLIEMQVRLERDGYTSFWR